MTITGYGSCISNREGGWTGVWGREVLARYSWACVDSDTRHCFWNQSFWERLDSLALWQCRIGVFWIAFLPFVCFVGLGVCNLCLRFGTCNVSSRVMQKVHKTHSLEALSVGLSRWVDCFQSVGQCKPFLTRWTVVRACDLVQVCVKWPMLHAKQVRKIPLDGDYFVLLGTPLFCWGLQCSRGLWQRDLKRNQMSCLGHLIWMPPRLLPGEVFGYVPLIFPWDNPSCDGQLVCEHFGIPMEEQDPVAGKSEVWAFVLSLPQAHSHQYDPG